MGDDGWVMMDDDGWKPLFEIAICNNDYETIGTM